MRVKHKAYFINNHILASRYVANMKTFRFVPNERGRHQFHLKLIRFWLYIYIGNLAYIISECNHKMRREPMRLSLRFFSSQNAIL